MLPRRRNNLSDFLYEETILLHAKLISQPFEGWSKSISFRNDRNNTPPQKKNKDGETICELIQKVMVTWSVIYTIYIRSIALVFFFFYHNVLAVVSSSLHNMYIDPGNQQEI